MEREAGTREAGTEAGMRGAGSASKFSPVGAKGFPLRQGGGGGGGPVAAAAATSATRTGVRGSPREVSEASAARAVETRRAMNRTLGDVDGDKEGAVAEDEAMARVMVLQRRLEGRLREVPPPPPPPPLLLSSSGGMAAVVAAAKAEAKAGRRGGEAEAGLLVLPGGGGRVSAGFGPLRCVTASNTVGWLAIRRRVVTSQLGRFHD